jgi:putative lipoprotein
MLPALLAMPLCLAVCAAAPSAGMRRVQGSVMLPDRTPLERGMLVVIRLQDVSRADAPTLLLAARRIEAGDNRQAPFDFDFDFGIEPERIDPRGRYTVSTRVEREGAVAVRQRYGVSGVDAGCGRCGAVAVAAGFAAAVVNGRDHPSLLPGRCHGVDARHDGEEAKGCN